MKKFEGTLICSDLDGTLLLKNKDISKENLDAIEYFKSEGGAFTVITGRMPWFVKDVYDAVRPNAPIGCINGGGVYDYEKGHYLWTAELPQSVIELVDLAYRRIPGMGIQVNTFDTVYFCTENSMMEYFRELTGVPNIVRDHRQIDEPIAKILFGDLRCECIEQLQQLLESAPSAKDFDFVRSDRTLFEILPRGIHKGTVLPRIAAAVGASMARTVAIGDYDNDIGMLRAAAIGVAVGNASPALKAVADHVTVSNEEHAIARVIEDLDRGVLRF